MLQKQKRIDRNLLKTQSLRKIAQLDSPSDIAETENQVSSEMICFASVKMLHTLFTFQGG